MKPSEKRTSTQLGLGKVSGELRHTTKRERVEPGLSESAPPISAPPPSGVPTATGQHPRHTRSLESAPPSERGAPTPSPSSVTPPVSVVRTESKPPVDGRAELIEIEDSPISVRGPSSSRTPIDVTHVDTNRLPRDGARAPSRSSDSREGRFAAEEKPTGRRLISSNARVARTDDRADPDTTPGSAGSRTVDGRPVGSKRADSARPESGRPSPSSNRPSPGSARPNSAGPSAGSARPSAGSARPAGRASGRPASIRPPRSSSAPTPSPAPVPSSTPAPIFTKSQRPSIREDNVGAAVKADAVRGTGRTIPKLLMSKAEIAAAPIDHRAGFLLAHIDGVTTVAALVDICGMPEDELTEILDRLRRLGIVAVR
jgi:hypothetical protein